MDVVTWMVIYSMAHTYYKYGAASISLPENFLYFAMLSLVGQIRELNSLAKSIYGRNNAHIEKKNDQ